MHTIIRNLMNILFFVKILKAASTLNKEKGLINVQPHLHLSVRWSI
jgi:hypothetical protein